MLLHHLLSMWVLYLQEWSQGKCTGRGGNCTASSNAAACITAPQYDSRQIRQKLLYLKKILSLCLEKHTLFNTESRTLIAARIETVVYSCSRWNHKTEDMRLQCWTQDKWHIVPCCSHAAGRKHCLHRYFNLILISYLLGKTTYVLHPILFCSIYLFVCSFIYLFNVFAVWPACILAYHMCLIPTEVGQGHLITWDCRYRQFCAALGVWESNLGTLELTVHMNTELCHQPYINLHACKYWWFQRVRKIPNSV